jgi:hypothetical protein
MLATQDRNLPRCSILRRKATPPPGRTPSSTAAGSHASRRRRDPCAPSPRRTTNAYHRDAARELARRFFTVVVRGDLLDLRFDLRDTRFDVGLFAGTVDDRGVLLLEWLTMNITKDTLKSTPLNIRQNQHDVGLWKSQISGSQLTPQLPLRTGWRKRTSHLSLSLFVIDALGCECE